MESAHRYFRIGAPLILEWTHQSTGICTLGKGAAGFFLGVCRQGICFIPVILLLPAVWGINGILYAQPIADVLTAVITIFMALHLHKELSIAEKGSTFGKGIVEGK